METVANTFALIGVAATLIIYTIVYLVKKPKPKRQSEVEAKSFKGFLREKNNKQFARNCLGYSVAFVFFIIYSLIGIPVSIGFRDVGILGSSVLFLIAGIIGLIITLIVLASAVSKYKRNLKL